MESVVGCVSKICYNIQIEGTAGADANQESLVVNPAFGLVTWSPCGRTFKQICL